MIAPTFSCRFWRGTVDQLAVEVVILEDLSELLSSQSATRNLMRARVRKRR